LLGNGHFVGQMDTNGLQIVYNGAGITGNVFTIAGGGDVEAFHASTDGVGAVAIGLASQIGATPGYDQMNLVETDETGVFNCQDEFNPDDVGINPDEDKIVNVQTGFDIVPNKWIWIGLIPFKPPRVIWTSSDEGTCLETPMQAAGFKWWFNPATKRSHVEFFDAKMKIIATGSPLAVVDLPLTVPVPATLTANEYFTSGNLEDSHLLPNGDMAIVLDNPATLMLLDNANNNILELQKDIGEYQATLLVKDGDRVFIHTLAQTNATHTVYEFQFANVPEFSMATMLLTVLLSGFVVMFVIRRRR